MASIRARTDNAKLFFDFRFRGKRCREQTLLDDTPANRKKLQKVLDRIEAEITLGSFNYASYFPDSPRAEQFEMPTSRSKGGGPTPLFSEFAESWFNEMRIQWRNTHIKGVLTSLNKYILPWFGNKEVGCITKADILEFRASLAMVKSQKGGGLTASRINHIITPLRMVLNEAANRFEFSSPYNGIKSLKVPKTDVEPFTLEEVKLIIDNVRPDFRNYYLVRFFTGMRTAEIDGLMWQFVDFDRRQILVRKALVDKELLYTKNDGSFRTIDMSQLVYDQRPLPEPQAASVSIAHDNIRGSNYFH